MSSRSDVFVGLMNESHDMSCFLNSAVQALFRMLNTHIDISNFPCLTAPASHSCLTCILRQIFERYTSETQFHSQQITTIALQHQIVSMHNNSVFQMNEKADSMEVLNALLVGVHNCFHGVYDSIHLVPSDRCACPVHARLTLNFVENHSCECGFYSTSPCSSLFQTYIPSKITGNLRELQQSEGEEIPYTLRHFERFCEYLAEQINEGLERQCMCGKRYKIARNLAVVPNYFIIQVVWDETITSKLKLLEFFVSLKFMIDIKEIYQGVRSEKFIIQGFIANIPGHYVYVGRNSEGWVIVNDNQILNPGTWEMLVEMLLKYRAKIVGIIYEKSLSRFIQEINAELLKMFEKSILSSHKCISCDETMYEEKTCESCGYSLEKYMKSWICLQCSSSNLPQTLVCKKCSSLRFKPLTPRCYHCHTPCGSYSCENHTPNKCFNCQISIYKAQERFCRLCIRSTGLERSCDYCSKEFELGELLCYTCAARYWTCMRCGARVCGPKNCQSCGTAPNARLWYCKACKTMNVQGSACSACRATETRTRFCAVCAGENSENKCSCLYSFTCAVCKEAKNSEDLQICWRDGAYLKDGVCEKCRELVPREGVVCLGCYDKSEKEEEGCIKDFVGNFRRDKRKAAQCGNCGKLVTANKIHFCWKCRANREGEMCWQCKTREVMCRDCVKCHFQCAACKCTIFGETCPVCTTFGEPMLTEGVESSVQKYDSDWACFSCNYYNRYTSEFCENCNDSKEYAFTEEYFCEYCRGKSHNKICKKCYWVCYCSNCEKKIFVTQKMFCGNCTSMLTNRFCKDCNEIISSERIICRGCTSRVNLCECGNKKHPKTLYCRYCRLKKAFPLIRCSFCREICEVNRCCYCDIECEGGICKNCSKENSEDNQFYCRNCNGKGTKCKICRNVCWNTCRNRTKEYFIDNS